MISIIIALLECAEAQADKKAQWLEDLADWRVAAAGRKKGFGHGARMRLACSAAKRAGVQRERQRLIAAAGVQVLLSRWAS